MGVIVADFFIICWMTVIFKNAVGQGLLKGHSVSCDAENGTIIDLSMILGNMPPQPCLTCRCSSGSIQCKMQTCAELATCPLAETPASVITTNTSMTSLSQQTSQPCCPKCRTCTYLGRKRYNDERWQSVEDNCIAMTCKAGIVTTSRLQCFAACRDDIRLSGYCCQLCRQNPLDAETMQKDPCLRCDFVRDKWYHCYRLACPVLDCPLNLQRQQPDKCCPECRHPGPRNFRMATTEVPRITGYCMLQLQRYSLGEVFSIDPCTKCHCQVGGITCRRFTCPVRECHASAGILFRPNVCCPFCHFETISNNTDETKLNAMSISDKIPSSSCRETAKNGSIVIYKHNSYFKRSVCLNCQCRSGTATCIKEVCNPDEPFHCPKGWKKRRARHQCCSYCEQVEATCTVFGDPHFKTFDGLTYSFNGNRSYILSRECSLDEEEQADFSVISHHAASENSIVERVSLILQLFSNEKPVKLLLAEGMTLLENNIPVPIPHNTSIYSAIENKKGHLEVIIPTLGLRLAFDGRGFAELTLSVAGNHKGRVCGLCGNFNNDPDDDLWPKYADSITNDTQYFGDSWRFKSSRTPIRCKSANSTTALNPLQAYDLAQCQILLENKFFAFCRKKLQVHRHLKNCIRDVCNCPSNATKPCFCQSIEAYATQCANKFVWNLWTPFINVKQLPVHPECDTIVKPTALIKNKGPL